MRRGWLIIFLACSAMIHLTVVLFVRLDVEAKTTPVIYGWPDIIGRSDLFPSQSGAQPSEQFIFSQDPVRRNYFFRPSDVLVEPAAPSPEFSVSWQGSEADVLTGDVSPAASSPQHFYLWEQTPLFTAQEPERASYRLFVSEQGKVLFIYPNKLAANSSGELRVQEHIRRATFFLNENFFWTNIEGVVK